MQNTEIDNIEPDEDVFLWYSVSQGNKKAFETLFFKYYTMMYSYSRYYVSTEDAEEIVQDVMMWLWEKRKEFVTKGTMRHYLLMSVKNKCLSLIRKQHLEVYSDDFFFKELDSFYEATDSCVVKELEATIEQAIAELPEIHRITFEMSRFQNKSRQEIAGELGISVKTVDYRLSQTVNLLKIKLKDYLPLLLTLWPLASYYVV